MPNTYYAYELFLDNIYQPNWTDPACSYTTQINPDLFTSLIDLKCYCIEFYYIDTHHPDKGQCVTVKFISQENNCERLSEQLKESLSKHTCMRFEGPTPVYPNVVCSPLNIPNCDSLTLSEVVVNEVNTSYQCLDNSDHKESVTGTFDVSKYDPPQQSDEKEQDNISITWQKPQNSKTFTIAEHVVVTNETKTPGDPEEQKEAPVRKPGFKFGH